LEEEFRAAVAWLQQLGDGQRVSIVPGNHDAYIPVPRSSSWDYWEEYLQSDTPTATNLSSAQMPLDQPSTDFPTVRIRGPIAFVGVCSAHPTGWGDASGTIGAQQLARIESVLHSLASAPFCRVILVHHPPADDSLSSRRRLTDAASFRAVINRAGADLVLHGHTHRTSFASLPGPTGPIPVVGVRSSSAIGHRPHRRARYNLYRIARNGSGHGTARYCVEMITRSYDAKCGYFVSEEEGI
jgi:3',5'-cyclic AMP phosphodiesterase CpdA